MLPELEQMIRPYDELVLSTDFLANTTKPTLLVASTQKEQAQLKHLIQRDKLVLPKIVWLIHNPLKQNIADIISHVNEISHSHRLDALQFTPRWRAAFVASLARRGSTSFNRMFNDCTKLL